MEKDQLVQLLQHYSGSSEKEAKEVVALRDEFPYCQVFQVLAARTSKDHGWSNQQSLLQMAAVASTDRAVLKEIMVALYTPVTEIVKAVKESATEAVTPVKESAGEKAKPVKEVTGIETVTHTKDLADTVIKDLERLKVLKHNFESLFMDTGNKALVKSAPVVSATRPTALEKPVQTEQPGGEKSQKSKKERIIELAKGLEPPVEPEPAKPVEGKAVHGKNSGGDPLIQEIKSTKKKIKPESEKTKEQIEIINQFIKSKPVMAPPKILSGENTENDLSSSIKSGEFGDNIVSETLVEILLRQGKKDKAIEVLKKLIWKFPQKKAYFAAQIDELKK